MFRTPRRLAAPVVAALALAAPALADSPPVGPLPAGPTSTIQTQKGQLVSFALPHRTGGKVWRIARPFNSKVLQPVYEGDIGASVVVVFKAVGNGKTTVAFGLTRGETAPAYEARKFVVTVRP